MTVSELDRLVADELLSGLVGQMLTQLVFRTGARLDFEGDKRRELTIEGSIVVTSSDGHEWSGEPYSAEAARELLPLRMSLVTSTAIAADGSLTLTIGTSDLHVPIGRVPGSV